MVLVDTSVWVRHLREGDAGLSALLSDGLVVSHPFIVGELACGGLRNRADVISLLQALPTASQLEHDEAMRFIETHRLMGKGLGYIDVHLLASSLLHGIKLWTLDRKLHAFASEIGIAYSH